MKPKLKTTRQRAAVKPGAIRHRMEKSVVVQLKEILSETRIDEEMLRFSARRNSR